MENGWLQPIFFFAGFENFGCECYDILTVKGEENYG